MPQRPLRTLSEPEYTAIQQRLLADAPDGLDEAGFQRWMGSRLAAAVGEAEASPEPVQGSALGRFASNAGAMLNPVTAVKGIAHAVTHPIDTVKGIGSAMVDQAGKARESYDQGDYSRMLGHGVAAAIPVLGPAAAEAGEQIAEGDIAGGLGRGAGMIAQMGVAPAARAVGKSRAVAGLRGSAADALRASAETGVVKALGATKERFKALSEKLAPEMLKRGIRGSRESLAAQAAEQLSTSGQAIDDALQQYGARQAPIQSVVSALERSKAAFQGTNAAGQTVIFEPRAIHQINGLQKVLTDLGPDVRVDQLVAVRRTWDKVVADAGGFSHRAPGAVGQPLKDISEAAIKRDATTAIRELLNREVPELTALNREFSFWKNLDDVVSQTLKRTQPQGPSLTGTARDVGGQVMGSAMSGGNLGAAVALGKVAKMAGSVFTSPRWRLASAHAKDALADAIVSNSPSKIATALAQLGRPARAGILYETTSPSGSPSLATGSSR
jgi:hypothetical protein